MNKCDPFYCEDLTRGHIFWCRTFCGGGLAGGRVVGFVRVELVGGGKGRGGGVGQACLNIL